MGRAEERGSWRRRRSRDGGTGHHLVRVIPAWGNAPGSTWEWDGAAWSEKSPTTVLRGSYAGAATRGNNVVLLTVDVPMMPRTYEWDGNDCR